MTYDEEDDDDEDDDGDEDGGYYWRRGFAGLRAIGIYRPVASWVSPRFFPSSFFFLHFLLLPGFWDFLAAARRCQEVPKSIL